MSNKLVYASYNESKNGSFDEAVAISKNTGHVTWFDSFRLEPDNIEPGTPIIIRIAAGNQYYRGTILAVFGEKHIIHDFVEGERSHRPPRWQETTDIPKTVFFINGLRLEEGIPKEVEGHDPPQHPIYI